VRQFDIRTVAESYEEVYRRVLRPSDPVVPATDPDVP
jgi:hypothetical protein